MKTLSSAVFQRYTELICSAKRVAQFALEEAARTDDENSFPEKTLELLLTEGFLTAAAPAQFGGLNLGLRPEANWAMLQVLKWVGSGNLVMGRVLEGHLNAQLLIDEYGAEEQKERFAVCAAKNELFGVWNTQAADGTELDVLKNGNLLLSGSKIFATGCNYVSRPLVTATLPDGSWQMCLVPLSAAKITIDKSWWHPMGMKSSRSFKITFEDLLLQPHDLLGKPDSYYRQPSFSGGAIRFAAVQLGGAERLLTETIRYLQELNRTEDPYQKARIGEMSIAVTSGNQWLEQAARQLDQYQLNPSQAQCDELLAFANMMRTAIEQICTQVMNLCQKCVGARGINKPYHFERIIRDLSTYLRQPAPDASLADVGAFFLNKNKVNF